MTTRILLLALTALLVTGCLKTRAELEAEQSGNDQQRQTVQQQKAEAAAPKAAAPYKEKAPPTAYRFEEYDEQMRALAGRVEAVENSVQQTENFRKEDREGANKNTLIIQEKFQAYEEALKKLDAQVQQLSEEVNKLKMAPTAPGPVHGSDANEPAAGAEKKAAPKNTYEEGEDLFGQKKWKEAVLKYQKYRDNNPKGTKYADATYKIGVSFQELGMKEEARSFYEEVVAKFPKAKEAKKASLRLKSLK